MKYFLSSLLLLMSLNSVAYDESAVPEEQNFQQLAKQMKQKDMGLLLMLHAEDCHYCELMDEKILSPMVRSGEYKKRIFLRKLQIDKEDQITDFTGKLRPAYKVIENYDSQLTPTLVFLNYKGEEKALNVIGLDNMDLIGGLIDQQIDELMQNL